MEAARPRTRGRRLRRGTVERPLNSRLVRVAFLVVVPAVLALLFSITTTTQLPRSTLEPVFDGGAAAVLARTLSTEYPSRVPGTDGAAGAERWYRETIATAGLTADEDTWAEDIADLGNVQLANVVTVIPGRSDETIVVVAHRDNAGASRPFGDNASGTAALIELARGYAAQEGSPAPRPQHTLVLVSTDGGAYGGAGAARFADTSPLARAAIAIVVLDGIGGDGRPRIAIAGDDPVSPARPLVRTAAVDVAQQVGLSPSLPSIPAQLLDFGMPFAGGEQGRFLAQKIAALTLTTVEEGEPRVPVGDPGTALDVSRLGQLGRATEELVNSLDASVGGRLQTPDSLFFADRAASGWAIRLVLVLTVVPFALGVVDLVARCRRKRLPFGAALRAQRTRLGFWVFAGLLVWIGALYRCLPNRRSTPASSLCVVRRGRATRRTRGARRCPGSRLVGRPPQNRVRGISAHRRAPDGIRGRARPARNRRGRGRSHEAVRAGLRDPLAVRVALASTRRTLVGTRRAVPRRTRPGRPSRSYCSARSSESRPSTPRSTASGS